MPKGYWVSVYPAITDADSFDAYNQLAARAVTAAGGRVLARAGGRVEAHEAGIGERVVLIEFDSFDTAVAARASALYQEALAELPAGFERDFRVVEGLQLPASASASASHPGPTREQTTSTKWGEAKGGKVRVSSGSPFEETIGFSRAVRVGQRVLVSGTGPRWPDGSCSDDAAVQARRCFEIISAALDEAGASLADVVRTRMLVTDAAVADAVGSVHNGLLGAVRPAATMVVVAGLLDPRWTVEIEAEAEITN